MPQFTRDDRCMIAAEISVWTAAETLQGIESAGAFQERVNMLCTELAKLGTELRDYNDQFEEAGD